MDQVASALQGVLGVQPAFGRNIFPIRGGWTPRRRLDLGSGGYRVLWFGYFWQSILCEPGQGIFQKQYKNPTKIKQ